MSLNIVKLCVGCSSIEDLQSWIDSLLADRYSCGENLEQIHTTRMVPKRIDELLDNGSLYWVIKGNIQCRQKFIDIRSFTDNESVRRCQFVLEPKIVLTNWQPKRPFQGWRYLKPEETPSDVTGDQSELPVELRQELANLGLL